MAEGATSGLYEVSAPEPRRMSRRESELSEDIEMNHRTTTRNSMQSLDKALKEAMSRPKSERDRSKSGGQHVGAPIAPPLSKDEGEGIKRQASNPLAIRASERNGSFALSPSMVARPVRGATASSDAAAQVSEDDLQPGTAGPDDVVVDSGAHKISAYVSGFFLAAWIGFDIVILAFTGLVGFADVGAIDNQFKIWAQVFCLLSAASVPAMILSYIFGPVRLAIKSAMKGAPVEEYRIGALPTWLVIPIGYLVLMSLVLAAGTAILATSYQNTAWHFSDPAIAWSITSVVLSWVVIAVFGSAGALGYSILLPVLSGDRSVYAQVITEEAYLQQVASASKRSHVVPTGTYGSGAPSVALGGGRPIEVPPEQVKIPTKEVKAARGKAGKKARKTQLPYMIELLLKLTGFGGLLMPPMESPKANQNEPANQPRYTDNEDEDEQSEMEYNAEFGQANDVDESKEAAGNEIMMRLGSPEKKAALQQGKGRQQDEQGGTKRKSRHEASHYFDFHQPAVGTTEHGPQPVH